MPCARELSVALFGVEVHGVVVFYLVEVVDGQKRSTINDMINMSEDSIVEEAQKSKDEAQKAEKVTKTV